MSLKFPLVDEKRGVFEQSTLTKMMIDDDRWI
jgi:hypothetical protein